MRYWMNLLIALLFALALVACEVDDTNGDATDTTGGDTTDTVEDTSAPINYQAVLIIDHWTKEDPGCHSASGFDGADIDAIALTDPATDDEFYAAFASSYIPDDVCNTVAGTDNEDAKGEPNGSLSGGFVSLHGGWLAVEFSGGLYLGSDYELTVYEYGQITNPNVTQEDPYDVYAVTSMDCMAGTGVIMSDDDIPADCHAMYLDTSLDDNIVIDLGEFTW